LCSISQRCLEALCVANGISSAMKSFCALAVHFELVRSIAKHHLEKQDKSALRGNLVEVLPLNRSAGAGWYTAELELGGKATRVIVDTASPWLWAYASSEATPADPKQHFTISYMSASLSGIVSPETLALGSAPRSNICRAGRATEGDSFWIKQWNACGVQGLLGLACGAADAGSPMEEGTPVDTGLQPALMCTASVVGAAGAPVFSLQLRESSGTLTFGSVPDDLREGLVQMPPSLFCGNWRVPLRVSVSAWPGEQNSRASRKGPVEAEAILDSAAKGIVGLAERVVPLATSLGGKIELRDGSMVFTIPCQQAASMPVLLLKLGSAGEEVQVAMRGNDLVVPDSRVGAANCRLILGTWDSPQWLLGIPFLKQIRGAVFDPNLQAVSIAP